MRRATASGRQASLPLDGRVGRPVYPPWPAAVSPVLRSRSTVELYSSTTLSSVGAQRTHTLHIMITVMTE
jgi:hypothetical protein